MLWRQVRGKETNLHVLVTGGAGFVGSHLCAALLAQGDQVTCLDTLLTGSLRNIAPLRSHPAFTFLYHDVSSPLPSPRAVDRVYHLASPASVPDYLAHPLETLRVNSQGTWAMLELALSSQAKFLFTSTSEVYGDPLVHPQPESYWGNVNPNGPRSCYDESKRFGEALTLQYVRSHSLDARIIRIFNTYGPHSRPDDGRIVPTFIQQALQNEPITIYGDGSQTRSFCYVSDLVRGLILAMETDGTQGEVINLGNPDEYPVIAFARVIAEHLGSDAGIVYRPLPVDDPTRRRPDISKAQSLLGWQPEVSLTEGIARTADWFRKLFAGVALVA